jgi:DNA-binding XRE family transcriptional regulator
MDQQYPWVPSIKHTCTPEEMRFGTCKCSQADTPPEKLSLRARLAQLMADDERTQAVRDKPLAPSIPELQQRLVLMPSGARIRSLRRALGWTQQRAADELGISKRTLIRHERGQPRRPGMRSSLLLRLCELESVHEPQLLSYLSRFGR